MDVLATSGGGNSGSTPNRSRAFDFNTFASELFSSLTVQKTASASTDEGSLGATVGLSTARPLDSKTEGLRLAFSAEGAYYANGGETSPRLAGLISQNFLRQPAGRRLLGCIQPAHFAWSTNMIATRARRTLSIATLSTRASRRQPTDMRGPRIRRSAARRSLA